MTRSHFFLQVRVPFLGGQMNRYPFMISYEQMLVYRALLNR